MKSFQLVAHGDPGRFSLSEIPTPLPGDLEVQIRVRACGLNHLDLWLEKGALPVPISLPRIPGGELSGEISALGGGVTGWRVGDRVAVQSNLFCGKCEFCAQGEESMCLAGQLLGVQRDGGFAEYAVVPVSSLVPLPASVSFEESAAVTLAASTAMHMLDDRVHVRSGDWVLVMAGASGVGSAAIQISKRFGAYVIATGSTEEKRQLSQNLGADFVIDPGLPDWPAEVRRITKKRGVDIVVEHIGGSILEQAFQCLARGGSIVTCGATMGREVSMNLWPFFVKQQRLVGSYGRNRKDMIATLQWVSEGRLKSVIDELIPLERAAEAFEKMRNRSVRGKLVIVP
jgi:2-desacetyl-2-hydroxyethyl bacteriochlorophyllide A dehydrogenase